MCKKTHLSCWRWLRSSSDNVRLNIPRNFWNLFLISFHGHFRHCDRNINANIVPVDMTVCKFVYNYYIPYTHTQHTFLLPHSLSCRFFFAQVNALIVSAYDIANKKAVKSSSDDSENIPIYNYVSTVQNPLKWGEFTELNMKYGFKYPFSSAIW